MTKVNLAVVKRSPKRTIINFNASEACKHGLITGSTGSGKTVTVQLLCEEFSRIGVPVIVTDIKGDLSGLSFPGGGQAIEERLQSLGITNKIIFEGNPTYSWDVADFSRDIGELADRVIDTKKRTLQAPLYKLGVKLLAQLMDLNDVQQHALYLIFKLCKIYSGTFKSSILGKVEIPHSLPRTLSQLNEILSIAETPIALQVIARRVGRIAPQTIASLRKAVTALQEEIGNMFFSFWEMNYPALFETKGGRGIINILNVDKLIRFPQLYGAVMVWLLKLLYNSLPEVGVVEKPKIAIFFDEAHTIFKYLNRNLTNEIDQIVRLIRSKGVALFFISQNPWDIPAGIRGQLAIKVHHAMRGSTVTDLSSIRAITNSLPGYEAANPIHVMASLRPGEAIISVPNELGGMQKSVRAYILPPRSRIGAHTTSIGDNLEESSIPAEVTSIVDDIDDDPSIYQIPSLQKRTSSEPIKVPSSLSNVATTALTALDRFMSTYKRLKNI